MEDKNFVGSLHRFAKMAGSRDSVNSILTHVYPYLLAVVVHTVHTLVTQYDLRFPGAIAFKHM